MLDPDPKSRPDTNKICSYFIGQTKYRNYAEIKKQFEEAEKLRKENSSNQTNEKTKEESEQHEVENSTSNENDENNKNDQSVIHPQAIYTSRLISISNLSGCSDMAI
ncbi:hypothetical protein RhiirA4_485735 [Rhizophagus irregularis]|uniref:Uncharacterized protein n=1 Tax=Rhizophagus irregularis TaxID=588596 RepID=A0A2I1HQH3_9GLOM|nr:hypothetical protein RhiirA4_485714 [Rhizophagus irregularis]PKY61149.1 hypothetical protein RhiirA4_485735 [Rhizophagus irregularis]